MDSKSIWSWRGKDGLRHALENLDELRKFDSIAGELVSSSNDTSSHTQNYEEGYDLNCSFVHAMLL